MPKTNILLNRQLLSDVTESKTRSDYFFAGLQKALNALTRAWSKYQPNDSLATERKQDLEWLKSTLHEYQLHIHGASHSQEFWEGCIDGKNGRRILSSNDSKSLAPILLKALTTSQVHHIYDLGIHVGWRYARLKNYLLRIKKLRKLEVAQQHQDYRQFLTFLRQKADPDDTDSFLTFGLRGRY